MSSEAQSDLLDVVDLVAYLRQRCAEVEGRLANDVVVLPVDLVLAIADGIEATTRPMPLTWSTNDNHAKTLADEAAKKIAALIVTRLFEPAKAEGEKAREACERLGLDGADIRALLLSKLANEPTGLDAWEKWLPLALGGAALSLMPFILGLVGKKEGPSPAGEKGSVL